MNKKLLALGIVLLMVFTMVTACGDGTTPSTSPSDAVGDSTAPSGTDTPEISDAPEASDAPDAQGASARDVNLRNKEVVASIASQPETIDPQKNSASDGSTLIHHFFEMLTGFGGDDGSGVIPAGAESWEVTQEEIDGETRNVYTFKLRANTWSDGTPVKADDYLCAMQRLVDPNTASPYAEDMGKFLYNGLAIASGTKPLSDLGVTVVDDSTLRVVQGDKMDLAMILGRSNFAPVRRDIVEANPEGWTLSPETYLTNGRYKMESWTNDAEIVMVRNEGYWDNANVYNDKITWKLMNDDVARLAAFRAQELDYAEGFPTEEITALQNEGVWNINPILGTYYVNFNHEREPFNNPKVREAFVLAIDSNFIANTVQEGTVTPANAYVGPGHTKPDGSEFYTGEGYYDLNAYEANCEKAREALAEAGYPNGEGFPVVEYIYNTSTGHQIIAEALQNMWQNVLGVQVSISSMEWNVMLETRRAGNFDIARNGWLSDFNDPASLLGLMYSSSGNNAGSYNNPAFDALIDQIGASDNQEERFALMRQAEDILMADWACGPVYYYSRTFVKASNFVGQINTALGNVFLWNARYE